MRRLILALVALTALVLLVDLARPSWTAPVREVAAEAASPVQRLIGRGDEVDRLSAQRDELLIKLQQVQAERDRMRGEDTVRAAAPTAGVEVVSARVVGIPSGSSPVGTRMLTIDRGRQDGVQADQTVLAAAGLVGRVLRTHPQTSDILLLGDPDVVVGVRYGPDGALGVLSAGPQPGTPERGPQELTLTALGQTPIGVDDQVRTIGSPGGRPYLADVPVGTVSAVDPDQGQLGRTAVVAPWVDLDALDHVAVLWEERG